MKAALAIGFSLVMTLPATAAEIGYYAQPAIHGQTLVFVSEGDLWIARLPEADLGATIPGDRTSPSATIIAHRLTASDGAETYPVISPAGDRIAFAAQYDGNTDVYVMPIDGGAPQRLTFHPAPDVPRAWMPDGFTILFQSPRAHPHGHPELWTVAPAGGAERRSDLGECTLISVSSTGRRFAFNPWSNEQWTWKRYRGGTAPDLWIGDFAGGEFIRLTDEPANDLFPMWILGRVYFISDRTGTFNIHSGASEGGDLRQHTTFAPDPADATAPAGYDVRWPSADASPRGTRIAFCQGGALALYDARADRVDRLDVRIASDRLAARRRFADAAETASEIALSPDGKTLLLGSRGEIVRVDVATGAWRQLTMTSGAREWGLSFLDDDEILLVTDAGAEQQIATMPVDGSEAPSLVTIDRAAWLFPPIAAPGRQTIAFAEKDLRLSVIDLGPIVTRQVDQAVAGEIDDYRFSPDGQWLAYVKPEPNGTSRIQLHALRTSRSFTISSGMTIDHEPRWDPAGRYLYFLSERHLDPILGSVDFDHVFQRTTRVYALPLQADTPPPLPAEAKAAGFDLEAWAKEEEDAEPAGDAGPEDVPVDPFAPPAPAGAPAGAVEAMRVDTDDMAARVVPLPIPPGNYRHLEAQRGAITLLSEPIVGLLEEDDWTESGLSTGRATLHRYDLVEEKLTTIAEKLEDYALSADGSAVAFAGEEGITVTPIASPEEAKTIAVEDIRLRVDARAEWKQMLGEAWRLQRDFYWAPNLAGVDWPALRTKYEALLPRIGSRAELNDLVGELIGELATSHTYVFGGQAHEHDRADEVAIGMLGADVEFDGSVHRITRILRPPAWAEDARSPLAAAHLSVHEGDRLLAVNGTALGPASNVLDLLQDQAGHRVALTVAGADGANRRTIEVETLESDAPLRYLAWVEGNRRAVAEASGGAIGYVHIPDMGGEGLSLFSRQFYPQFDKPALVIDVRDNNGGFVSQMIIERVARQVIAFAQPRHGTTERYPYRAPHAHMAVLIDQFAGSDGDVFPAAFRVAGLGPLIGMRTWGGVIGIRGDKPFVDLGLSTQPEFAWWDQRGWSIENVGVAPDIEVPITPADRRANRDPQLARAIEHLRGKLAEDPKALPPVPPYPARK
jgi:tricorn protease